MVVQSIQELRTKSVALVSDEDILKTYFFDESSKEELRPLNDMDCFEVMTGVEADRKRLYRPRFVNLVKPDDTKS